MPRRSAFTVLVATDGSQPAEPAVAAAVRFPWPQGARAHGVLARSRPPRPGWPHSVTRVIRQSELRAAFAARRVLRGRWPDAEVVVVDQSPVGGILAEARRLDAQVVVVGARGHGALSRLVLGSVSLGVVRQAGTAVFVVKRPLRDAQRLLIGVDGSAHSRKAVELVARLAVPDGGAVTLVAVVEPLRPVSVGLLPSSIRGTISGELAALEAERTQHAQRELNRTARRLKRAGWAVETEVRTGIPLVELLGTARESRADVLVLGARGVGGVERLLLGSVAEGALSRAPLSVLIVR
jgi:nucleotide-binding universal stress UspA family protein